LTVQFFYNELLQCKACIQSYLTRYANNKRTSCTNALATYKRETADINSTSSAVSPKYHHLYKRVGKTVGTFLCHPTMFTVNAENQCTTLRPLSVHSPLSTTYDLTSAKSLYNNKTTSAEKKQK